jgi:HSP20 family protein
MFHKNNGSKSSFFRRLIGVGGDNDERLQDFTVNDRDFEESGAEKEETRNGEGELAVDIYQTDKEIIIQTMPAGVRSDDLNITITPDTIIISGKREAPQGIAPSDYMLQELYWGSFSRTIVLPEEVEPNEAEAIEKHGLLVIRLPKIDKQKRHKLKVKSV